MFDIVSLILTSVGASLALSIQFVIGAICVWPLGWISTRDLMGGVSTMALKVLLPVLMFQLVATSISIEQLQHVWILPVISICICLASLLYILIFTCIESFISYFYHHLKGNTIQDITCKNIVSSILPWKLHPYYKCMVLSVGFQNAIALPLTYVDAFLVGYFKGNSNLDLLRSQAKGYICLFSILNNILLFSIADPYLNGFHGTWKLKIKMIVDVILSPALLSIILGIVVGLIPGGKIIFSLQLPILNMIPYLITVFANGALPCINLIMGCNIIFNVISTYKMLEGNRLKALLRALKPRYKIWDLLLVIIIKQWIIPGIVYAVCQVFISDQTILLIAVLEGAAPMASILPLIIRLNEDAKYYMYELLLFLYLLSPISLCAWTIIVIYNH